ncbi:MAG: single-stranded DNA-binding protein [bacterium]
MMDFQQLMLVGRATKDAEALESKEGKKFAKFGLAINEYRGKDLDERTTFYNVLIFNKSQERIESIKKGNLLYIQGRPDIDAYLSKSGEAKANLVMFADRWKVIS